MSVCVWACAGGIFEEDMPAVVTVTNGETYGTFDIAINNDATLISGSQLLISLTSVQLHTGQSTYDLIIIISSFSCLTSNTLNCEC